MTESITTTTSSFTSKRKHLTLTIGEKLKVLDALEMGITPLQIVAEFGIAKSTVSDIKKNKQRIRNFASRYEAVSSVSEECDRKTMKLRYDLKLDEAVYDWYKSLNLNDLEIRGTEIQVKAEELARELNVKNFTASNGWLWRFRKRHNIGFKKRSVETSSNKASTENVCEAFKKKLKTLMNKNELLLSQVYCAHVIVLDWKSLPDNLVKTEEDCEEKLVVLLCSNGDGSQRLRPGIIGNFNKYDFNNTDFHCNIYSSLNGRLNQELVHEWFHTYFIPTVKVYQTQILQLPEDQVQAILIVDSNLGDCTTYSRADPNITTLIFPKNINNIHPMRQGILDSFKRLYRKKFLEEIIVSSENDEEKPQINLKTYSVKCAFFNVAKTFKEIRITTLVNSWKKLLYDINPLINFENLEISKFRKLFELTGIHHLDEEDIEKWLLSEEDYGEFIDNDVFITEKTSNLAEIRNCLDTLINHVDSSSLNSLNRFYPQLREIKEVLIREQWENMKTAPSTVSIKKEYVENYDVDPLLEVLMVVDSN